MRLVLEHGGEYPSEWAAIGSISGKVGMTKETLRRAQVDGGLRFGGVTTLEREWIRELERENRELRRANEILSAASLFIGSTHGNASRPDFAGQWILSHVPDPGPLSHSAPAGSGTGVADSVVQPR